MSTCCCSLICVFCSDVRFSPPVIFLAKASVLISANDVKFNFKVGSPGTERITRILFYLYKTEFFEMNNIYITQAYVGYLEVNSYHSTAVEFGHSLRCAKWGHVLCLFSINSPESRNPHFSIK